MIIIVKVSVISMSPWPTSYLFPIKKSCLVCILNVFCFYAQVSHEYTRYRTYSSRATVSHCTVVWTNTIIISSTTTRSNRWGLVSHVYCFRLIFYWSVCLWSKLNPSLSSLPSSPVFPPFFSCVLLFPSLSSLRSAPFFTSHAHTTPTLFPGRSSRFCNRHQVYNVIITRCKKL